MEVRNCTWPEDASSSRKWIVPLIVVCVSNVLSIVAFEAYVAIKWCGWRRLFLGQTLLLGLLLASLIGFAFIPSPSPLTCALTRAGAAISGALILAALLVKCLFLLSLHAGSPLSAAYQGLLLLVSVAAQAGVAAQWLVYADCTCTWAMAPAAYCALLLIAVAGFAVRARRLPENGGEAVQICTCVGLAIPLWIACTAVSATRQEYAEACLAFGLALTASLVFVVMFLPKGRRLASMERWSDNQSVYTPSFLHLKPPFPPEYVERGFFLPPPHHASRLWRYTHHPATLQLPPLHPFPEDIYLSSDRYLFGPPGMKLYRSPLY